VGIAVRIEPAGGGLPDVEYRWDPDTDILTANLRAASEGTSGLVEVEGRDGSWLVFDLTAGSISGVEVAVWPDVRKRSTLAPPAAVEDARVTLPSGGPPAEATAFEVNTALAAEADTAERTIHFRLGGARQARVVRIARDMLLDVDGAGRLAGVWLLNVPPFPEVPEVQ
jgi:hypothetical protein